MKCKFPYVKIVFLSVLLTFQSSPTRANSAPELDLQDWVVGEGNDVSFVVVPVDNDGVVPDLYMLEAPDDATLEDNGDGTRTFSWQPSTAGVYTIDFVVKDAQDPALSNRYESQIVVVESGEALPESMEEAIDIFSSEITQTGVPAAGDDTIFLGDQPGVVTKILSELPVSKSQTNVQQTPIDIGDGYLYTVNIEPGPSGDGSGFDLLTVLRQGRQNKDNAWEWKSVVIEDRTAYNRWHTAPSVAVDKTGRLHVAYNMHNLPWQYKRSDNAHDIDSMKFKGQQLSDAEIKRAITQNKTSFPTLGTAQIPGNQITYPSFYKDRGRDLYVSYRFAATPKRSFANRTMSSGIAVYNALTQTWASIGKPLDHAPGDFEPHSAAPDSAVVFAGKKGWTSYFPKLVFDKRNNMLVSLVWREGGAGQLSKRPCIVQTTNRQEIVDLKGNAAEMPLQPEVCSNLGIGNNDQFYSIGSFAISENDSPYVLLSPYNGPRFIMHFDKTNQQWVKQDAPEMATEIFFDAQNNLYAITSGIKIFKRSNDNGSWETIYDEGSKKFCYPKVQKDESGKNAFIHAQSCDEKTVTIYGLRLP